MFKLLASTVTLLLLVQALGLQLLCFCGSCPTSAALGLTAASAPDPLEHPCCHARHVAEQQQAQQGPSRTRDHSAHAGAQLVDRHSCCAANHAVSLLTATAPSRPGDWGSQPELYVVLRTCPAPLAVLTQVEQVGPQRARGPPPNSGVPIYLSHGALLI